MTSEDLEELREFREYVADELRDYREERGRLKARRLNLEEDLVEVKADQGELEERLVVLLLNGRDAGLSVQTMVRLAAVSRNKAHRVTRYRSLQQRFYERG